MRSVIRAAVLLSLACILPAQSVQSGLARLDAAAPGFHAMEADVQMVTYTSVIDDHTTETGHLKMQKLRPDELRAIIAFTGADQARTLALLGKKVIIYYPAGNSYQTVSLGDKGQLANQLLLLGFGSSGKDLAQSYDIQFAGSETIGGQPSDKLELIPKDASVRQSLAKVDLWIPVSAGYPVQQQFFDPVSKGGNWRKVTYGNINLDPALKGTLDFKLPKGATKASD